MATSTDEQGPFTGQNGSAPHFDYSSLSNPGRRLGERASITQPNENEKRRLFGREGRQEPSDFHPAPRPRDEKGQVQPRMIVHDPAMPDPVVMREKYASALALIQHYRPFRAALLEDMLSRIEHALKRFRSLEAGEEKRFQNRNEEFRRADTWLDNRIGELRAECGKLAVEWDAQVAERQEALALAREVASVSRVAAGLPLHFKELDAELDPEDQSTPEKGADLAGLAQAATQAVLPAVNSSASSLQKIGGMLSRLRGNVSVAAQGALPAEATSSPGVVSFPKAYPETVPFPLDEGIAQARPETAIAVEQGLLYQSPTARAMEGKQKWLAWVALVACGGIFGISIGLLTQVLNIDLVSLNPGRAAGSIALLVFLGIAMFWVLGRVVFAAAALASEERHSHLIASHRDDTAKVGEWLRRAALWSLGLLPVIGIALVTIEAMVERYGIVRVFVDSTKNTAFASGHDAVASAQPSDFAIVCLVLMVSLPFVLFHMAEGWVHARDRVIHQYLTGRRHKEGWEIAKECHQERTAKTHAQFERECEEAQEKAKAEKAKAASSSEAPNAVALTIQAGLPAGVPGTETETEVKDAVRPVKLEEPPVRMVDVALAMERARECYARVREARARRQEALAWHEARIAAYEEERQRERTEPENASKLRLEDAYADYLGAVMDFDKTYRQEMLQVEKMMRGGLLMRFWLSLTRRPASS